MKIRSPEWNFLTFLEKRTLTAPARISLFIIFLPFVFLLFFLASCSPKTQAVSLPLQTDTLENFSVSGTMVMPERWWMVFGDNRLNTLIDSALTNNFNLKSVWQRLQAAQAVVDRESSLFLPTLGASLQGAANFPEPDFRGGENFRLGLSSDYEVDLWGRIEATVDAERFRVNATYADYQTAELSLSAEIVRTWYQLLEAKNQVELVEEQIQTNEQILNLLENRFSTGQIRGVDILRQRQLVAATREQQVFAESRAEVLEHQLLVLTGRPPQQELNYAIKDLPGLPPLPTTGIPIELVRRRPDIQSAFNLLLAADRELAAAISNKYPRLSLNAASSLRSNNFDNIFKSWAYSFAGNLFAPIFYGGELNAEVDRTEAVKQQLLYEYGQSVLIAFQEVEDALIQERKQQEQIEIIEEQLELLQKTYEQLRIEYFNGLSEYLDVLTALTQEQQLRRDLLSENLTLLEFRISLYRALAGGFETARGLEE